MVARAIEGRPRDARDVELALRRPLSVHRAPQPLTIRMAAGGWTEWLRGAEASLRDAVEALGESGYCIHAPLSDWLAAALRAQMDVLHDWSAGLSPEELEHRTIATAAQRCVRNTLDAHAALGVAFEDAVPAAVLRWYRALPAA